MSNHVIVTCAEPNIYGATPVLSMSGGVNGNKIKNVREKTIILLGSPLAFPIDVHFDWFGDLQIQKEIYLGPKFTRTIPAEDSLIFGPFPKEMEDNEGYVRWTYTFHGFPFVSVYGIQLP